MTALISADLQQEHPGGVVTATNPLGDVPDDHALLAEAKNLLLLGGCQTTRPGAYATLCK
ncbi:hypothetical protein GCM10010212_08080 [Paenarthrobacter nicotinovorans]|nr:hypothetical protein GCM10010212_08080 [Paenarthrobacter nicotinovorans]